MRNRFVLPLTATLMVLSGLAAPAQQPAGDQPVATLKAQAREVLLPVTVRDKHGALATNLTASDFTLTEDGRLQVIKSFTRESNLPFRLGLLVDTSRNMSGAMDAERNAAGKFVDLMLPASPRAGNEADQAFLIHFDREVELLEDFTNSRDKLHHELDDMGPTRGGDSSISPETTGDDSGEYGQRGGGSTRSAGAQLYDAIYLASNDLMKLMDGRKALVVFSDGLDRGSKETLSEALDAAERANVSVYTIYFRGEQEHDISNGYPGGHHRVGMGGGWPGGGRHGEQQGDGKKIMQEIAQRTGARFYEAKKKDNLAEIYNQIADELRGQYLLTYTPDKVDTDGGYHKIVLKADKGDLEVVTREGYYAPEGSN